MAHIFMCGDGLLGRALAPSVEGQWFKLWSGQVKDWKIGTCYFPG